MEQPLFPSTISAQSRFAYFLTVKAVVRKFGKSDGQTGCLDKAVLARAGGYIGMVVEVEILCAARCLLYSPELTSFTHTVDANVIGAQL